MAHQSPLMVVDLLNDWTHQMELGGSLPGPTRLKDRLFWSYTDPGDSWRMARLGFALFADAGNVPERAWVAFGQEAGR